jgi:hypothetical protein
MITFLPHPDFVRCARVLDRQRLGKQRLETRWVLERITNEKLYFNHPLLRMWKPYKIALCNYGIAICEEWIYRGYRDNQLQYFVGNLGEEYDVPYWITDERLFSSHRAALLSKDYDYYSQFSWDEKPELNYYWPE